MRQMLAQVWGKVAVLLLAVGSLMSVAPRPALAQCPGDCDGNGSVTVDELVMVVNIGLGNMAPAQCAAADVDHDEHVIVNEMVMSVNAALDGCGGPSNCETGTTPFKSTFEGIQKVIFEKRGCLEAACHGSSAFPQGGLNLSPDVAYQNLLEVPSTEISLNRVEPGDVSRSFLWLKLAAATDPTKLPPGVTVPGAPMPNGLNALTADELEAVRLWIYDGAPKTGTVSGTETLLNACLPPPVPIIITPLDPPNAGEGIQLVMPPWKVEAHSEHEICFATYYDFTDKVPQQFRDPSGALFRFKSQELRQDPFSHHLILNRYVGSADDIHDPSFGDWTCKGGEKAGQTCEPTDQTSCGSGACTSEIKQSFACIGFGPGLGLQSFYAIGGAQKAQATSDLFPGVFAQFPMKGIFYWNSHAFNLTNQDADLHARLNYYFADDTRFPVQGIFDTSKIFAANAMPYTTQTLCQNFTLPQGTRLFELSSHTHKHGKHFTVNAPDGTQIYESFIYNDPVTQRFDPPMAFDAPSAKDRTLKYCSLYNNGVTADGEPDPTLVTRASLVPTSAASTFGSCSPIACVSGKVGAACNGTGDDRTCDTAPGANDGMCDACRITGGESTQNEMFILIGSYYIDPSGAGAGGGAAAAQSSSMSTEVIVPPQLGCSASHAAHTSMHASHAGH